MRRKGWVFVLLAMVAGFSFGQAQQGADNGSQVPPEQAARGAELIMGYAEAPLSIDRTEKELGLDTTNYPTNTSLGYKGVVMANFHTDDTADEIAVDFGSTGLWMHDSGTWYLLSGVNPDGMISVTWGATTDDELIVDFGSLGVWRWDYSGYPGSWVQWSGVNPEGMFGTDDDNDGLTEVHADFGSLGVWRLDADGPWTQLSVLNPYKGLKMDTFTYGWQEGCWSFPTVGVWRIFDASPIYTQLTGTVNANDDHASARFTNPAGAEDLVMDFSTLGLWLLEQNSHTAWHQISTMSVNRVKEVLFRGGLDYELLAEDNVGGLYWGNWNGSTFTWTLITNAVIGPGWCETFDRDGTDSGDEEVIIPANAGGAYIFDYSAGSTLNQWISVGTNWPINFMVKGDYYNRGYDSTLAVVFGSTSDNPGLWLWDQATSWVKISSYVPDGIY